MKKSVNNLNPLLGTRKLNKFNYPRKNPRSSKTQIETDALADYLVEKFNSPEYRPFFLRVAWRLDGGTIDRYVATSFELGKNPRAYFISLVKREKAYYEQKVHSKKDKV